MSRGVLGRRAVRFLAAAGVSSAACAGRYADTTEGAAGSSGALATGGGSKASSGGNPNANGGGSPNDSVAGEPPSAVGGATDAPGASGSPPVEPEPVNQFPCLNPSPFSNPGSGLERCDEAELLTHGVLSPRNAARLALAAFDAVIAPCADAKLESAPARGGEARDGRTAPSVDHRREPVLAA
jgi:hypothetical protein